MSAITTHVLDTAKGRPANGVPIILERFADEKHWNEIGSGVTDADGRLSDLLPREIMLLPGTYRLTFDTKAYFTAQRSKGFYPVVTVTFVIRDVRQHYHVPLLLSPYGFSTYRGS